MIEDDNVYNDNIYSINNKNKYNNYILECLERKRMLLWNKNNMQYCFCKNEHT